MIRKLLNHNRNVELPVQNPETEYIAIINPERPEAEGIKGDLQTENGIHYLEYEQTESGQYKITGKVHTSNMTLDKIKNQAETVGLARVN